MRKRVLHAGRRSNVKCEYLQGRMKRLSDSAAHTRDMAGGHDRDKRFCQRRRVAGDADQTN